MPYLKDGKRGDRGFTGSNTKFIAKRRRERQSPLSKYLKARPSQPFSHANLLARLTREVKVRRRLEDQDDARAELELAERLALVESIARVRRGELLLPHAKRVIVDFLIGLQGLVEVHVDGADVRCTDHRLAHQPVLVAAQVRHPFVEQQQIRDPNDELRSNAHQFS